MLSGTQATAVGGTLEVEIQGLVTPLHSIRGFCQSGFRFPHSGPAGSRVARSTFFAAICRIAS